MSPSTTRAKPVIFAEQRQRAAIDMHVKTRTRFIAGNPSGKRGPKGPPRIQPVGGGETIHRELSRAARDAGVVFRHSCAADALIADDNGAIAGVQLSSGETLPADAAILACGGFQANAAMMREHFGDGGERAAARAARAFQLRRRHPHGAGARRGFLRRAGRHAHRAGRSAQRATRRPVVLLYPYGIVVDRDGRRFFDEGAGLVHETWEAFSRRLHFEVPGRMAFAILDARVRAIPDWQRATRSEVPPYEAADARRARQIDRRRRRQSLAHGRGLQRRLHRRPAKVRRHHLRRPRRVARRSRRRNRTGRAPSPSRRSSPGRSSAPSPTPSAGSRPTPAPACSAAARRSPASTPPARSPGISTAPRRTRCRCCARSCSAGSREWRRRARLSRSMLRCAQPCATARLLNLGGVVRATHSTSQRHVIVTILPHAHRNRRETTARSACRLSVMNESATVAPSATRKTSIRILTPFEGGHVYGQSTGASGPRDRGRQ